MSDEKSRGKGLALGAAAGALPGAVAGATMAHLEGSNRLDNLQAAYHRAGGQRQTPTAAAGATRRRIFEAEVEGLRGARRRARIGGGLRGALAGGALGAAGVMVGRAIKRDHADRDYIKRHNAWADEMGRDGNTDRFNQRMADHMQARYGKDLVDASEDEWRDAYNQASQDPHFAGMLDRHFHIKRGSAMTPFFAGFTTELVKVAAGHPLFQPVTKGGTLLGRKVQGAVQKAKAKAKLKKKAGEGAQSLPFPMRKVVKKTTVIEKKPLKKKAGEGAQSIPMPNMATRPKPLTPPAPPKPQPMPGTGNQAIPMAKRGQDEQSDSEAAAENLRRLIEDAQQQLAPAGEEMPMSAGESFGTGRPQPYRHRRGAGVRPGQEGQRMPTRRPE